MHAWKMEGDIGGDLELVGEPFPFLDVELF